MADNIFEHDILSLNQSDTTCTPNQSMSSIIGNNSQMNLRSPRTPTPRRSITPRQAIDILQLGVTQANDVQHLFEQYLQQIDQHATNTKENIDKHFDQIIKQLQNRKSMLHQQVDAWKSEKIMSVNTEIHSAGDYEETLLKAQKTCNEILADDKLDIKQKKSEIKQIKSGIFQGDDIRLKKFNDNKLLTQYINDTTNLISIGYQPEIALNDISKYGVISQHQTNSFLAIPTLSLLKPMKIRESKSGYKLKLKWKTSVPLIADNFMIRCLTMNDMKNNNDDEKRNEMWSSSDNHLWKSLIFQIKKGDSDKATEFETADIETVFLFDKAYKLRIEYHITDPVNLLIGSNEHSFCVENKPPQSDKADLIELEYASHRGNSYEGHPKNLLVPGKKGKYRSIHNKDFDYGEHDWIIFKIKHSGYIRQYLPKVIVVRNSSGTQAIKTLILSIGDKADGKEWHKYTEIELRNEGDEMQQIMLDGVDWRICKQMRSQFIKLELMHNYGENRGQQCRFKFHEFQVYGLEF